MKKWTVSDIRWANTDDLRLPFWQKWNRKNPLPDGFFQRIWEYPYVASKIPQSDSSLDIGGTYPFVLFKNFPNATSVDCRNLNKLNHPLHYGKWPKNKLIVCDAATVPVADNSYNYVFSISSIEEMPNTFEVLKEMIRIAKYRVVVTMDVSDVLGVSIKKLREFEEFLKTRIPILSNNALTSISDVLNEYGQSKKEGYKHIRTLAFTLDSCDEPKSVAILIPHWNSWPFLKLCLKLIQKYRNKALKEKVYVLDDASTDGSFEKAVQTFKKDNTIKFYRFDRPNKSSDLDIGLLLDNGLKIIKEQYVAMIDVDVFPLSKDWLTFPIWLLEQNHCSSVGLDTGLSSMYLRRTGFNRWWQPDTGYIPGAGFYDNQWFSCTNNLYRVMNSALAKIVSENIGFSRATLHISKLRNTGRIRIVATWLLERTINRLRHFLGYNPRFPYFPGGEDNGVAANHFIDINRMGPKFNIPLTSYIGLTTKEGAFGQNISGLIFHFALSRMAKVESANNSYAYWLSQIQKTNNINATIIQKMFKKSRKFQPGRYDSSIPALWYRTEYKYIQKLLNQYRNSK